MPVRRVPPSEACHSRNVCLRLWPMALHDGRGLCRRHNLGPHIVNVLCGCARCLSTVRVCFQHHVFRVRLHARQRPQQESNRQRFPGAFHYDLDRVWRRYYGTRSRAVRQVGQNGGGQPRCVLLVLALAVDCRAWNKASKSLALVFCQKVSGHLMYRQRPAGGSND